MHQQLAQQYDLGSRKPNIQVWNVDLRGDPSLTLRHFVHDRRPLHESLDAVLDHIASLWGFTVCLERQNADGSIELVATKQVDRRLRD